MNVKFPSIKHYREVLREYRKLGIYGKVNVVGYPKVHGTNGSILFTDAVTMIPQSKETALSESSKDGYGFYDWCMANSDALFVLHHQLLTDLPVRYPFEINGEWAGGKIAIRSSVEGLDEFFAVFGVSNVVINELGAAKLEYIDTEKYTIENPSIRVWDIKSMGRYELTIDISFPELSQNELGSITSEAEAACPVAKFFGVDSPRGEGVVWHCSDNMDRHLWFKVKGHKHSVVKTRILAAVNQEKIDNILEFIEYAVTENRMEQAVQETGPIVRENLGAFLKWLNKDIIKEETDTLESNGMNYKEVSDRVNTKAIAWYRNRQS